MRNIRDFQIYSVSFLALAAAAVSTQVLTFDAASDFDWFYGSFSAVNSASSTALTESTRAYPPINVLMTPGDTSSQFMNQAVPITHFFGNGEMPFVLPAPRTIPARSTMTFQVTNNDTAISFNLYLSLIGVKRYI
jgi:hypothetical protein